MFPYWLMFLLVAAGASIERVRINTLHRYSTRIVFLMLVIILMVGLRFEVGGDWETYELIHDFTGRRSFAIAIDQEDPGYQALSWVTAQAGYEIWSLNLLCGVVFTWGLIQLARNQPSPVLAILVAVPYLVIVVAMGYSRQAVAIGFIMAGLASVERGAGIIRFAVYVLLAALFHRTAIVVLPIVMFAVNHNYFVNMVAGVILTLGLYYSLLADSMDVLVKNYIQAKYNSQGAAIRVAMNVIPAALMLWRGKDLQFGENQYRLWRLIALVAIALIPGLFLVPSSTAIDRLALYVLPIQVVVLPRAIMLFRHQAVGRAVVIAYAAAVLLVWLNFASHSKWWLPYKIYPIDERERLEKRGE